MNFEKNNSWKSLAALLLGGTICLPLLIVGYELGQLYSLTKVIRNIIVGNMVLGFFGIIIAHVSITLKIPTFAIAARIFGKQGIYFFSTIIALTMLGWASVQIDFMSSTIQTVLTHTGIIVDFKYLALFCGGIVGLLCLRGISFAGWISLLIAPILLTIFITSLFPHVLIETITTNPKSFGIIGIVPIVAVMIGLIVDSPLFLLGMPSWSDANKVIGTFLFGAAGVEIIGAILGSYSLEKNALEMLTNGGVMWQLLIVFSVFASGVLANTANMYSATAGINQLSKNKIPSSLLIIVLNFIAIIIALFRPTENFIMALELLGGFIGCLGSLMTTWYLFRMPLLPSYSPIISITIGYLFVIVNWLSIFSIFNNGMIDGMIVTMIAYSMFTIFLKKSLQCKE